MSEFSYLKSGTESNRLGRHPKGQRIRASQKEREREREKSVEISIR